jgi:hypothetical protein
MDYLDKDLIALARRLKASELISSVALKGAGMGDQQENICLFDTLSPLAQIMRFILDCEKYYPDARERLRALLEEIE